MCGGGGAPEARIENLTRHPTGVPVSHARHGQRNGVRVVRGEEVAAEIVLEVTQHRVDVVATGDGVDELDQEPLGLDPKVMRGPGTRVTGPREVHVVEPAI